MKKGGIQPKGWAFQALQNDLRNTYLATIRLRYVKSHPKYIVFLDNSYKLRHFESYWRHETR